MTDARPVDAEVEEEWATVGAPTKPRRLAPQTTLTRPEFHTQTTTSTVTSTAVVSNKPDEEPLNISVKKVIRFGKDDLLAMRPRASELLPSISENVIPEMVSAEAIDPEVSKNNSRITSSAGCTYVPYFARVCLDFANENVCYIAKQLSLTIICHLLYFCTVTTIFYTK